MDTESAISTLIEAVPDPSSGLPDDIFYYISRTTPLVNVDLLIQDEQGRTLLSWRNDPYTGAGWHIPGGIVRFKERIETRIEKVAVSEIGSIVQFLPVPIAIHQCIHKGREIRGHFISFLFQCFLPGTFNPQNGEIPPKDNGYLLWHDQCPADLLKLHEVYRDHINMNKWHQDTKKSNEFQQVIMERIL